MYNQIIMKNTYVVLSENNHKEQEQFYFYLQYNSNEEQIIKLNELIKNADISKLDGDYSNFQIDVTHFISENSVLDHIVLDGFGNYANLFTMCNGKLNLPSIPPNMSPTEIAKWLDEKFYACQIIKMFTK
jgi:hypothetical protein